MFYSPNYMKDVQGTLLLSNGDSAAGKISLNNEVLLQQKISLYNREEEKRKFQLHDLKGYVVNDTLYELRHIMKVGSLNRDLFFMKRLTPLSSKIHLYEHHEKNIPHRSGKPSFYQTKYYVQFANDQWYSVWALNSERMLPHFHQKMSEVVKSCPELSKKILSKEEGYSYGTLDASELERAQVIMRIINEYNRCTNYL
jgi:hypothetical protein